MSKRKASRKIGKIEQKIEEYREDEQKEIVEVVCSTRLHDFIISRDEYEVTPGNDIKNRFCGVDIRTKGSDDSFPARGYKIVTEKLYHLCDNCLEKKMFDEKNSSFYCPSCDSSIDRLKDKLFNWRD